MLLSPKDIKNELWKAEFRALFPELRELIQKYFASPTCGRCFETLLWEIQKYPDRLKTYFKEDITFVPTHIKRASEAEIPPGASAVGDSTPQLSSLPRPTPATPPKWVPIRRIFRLFQLEEVEKGLESYPPSKYRIEAMAEVGGRISILLLEFGSPQPYTTDEEDPLKKKEIVERAIAEIRGKVPDELKVKLDVLRAYLFPSPQASKLMAEYHSRGNPG